MDTETKQINAYKERLSGLVELMIKENASDMHFSVGHPPTVRVAGSLVQLLKEEALKPKDVEGLFLAMVRPEQLELLQSEQELDYSYAHGDSVRFRCNATYQRGTMSIAMRLIPRSIPTVADLNLPTALELFAQREQGFFLVVGPVGQGKSTTLAAMVEYINSTRSERIVTIEDPVEYQFESKQSIIDQREVRIDTKSFSNALRSAFRQDVNIIMVGEMRGTDTMSAAVTAAETGHLVFSTLHTNNAAQTIDRVIDSFPAHQQDQIRIQLASSLLGIFSQRLIPRISGGLIPSYELLIVNKAVSNLIREKRTHEINNVIETSAEEGMISMNKALADLVRRGEITVENAFRYSLDPQVLERLM